MNPHGMVIDEFIWIFRKLIVQRRFQLTEERSNNLKWRRIDLYRRWIWLKLPKCGLYVDEFVNLSWQMQVPNPLFRERNFAYIWISTKKLFSASTINGGNHATHLDCLLFRSCWNCPFLSPSTTFKKLNQTKDALAWVK